MVVSRASGTLRASRLKRNKFSEPASALVRGSGARSLVRGSGAPDWCALWCAESKYCYTTPDAFSEEVDPSILT